MTKEIKTNFAKTETVKVRVCTASMKQEQQKCAFCETDEYGNCVHLASGRTHWLCNSYAAIQDVLKKE